MATTVERIRTVLAEHYLVERELGRGGMATVYVAYDLRLDRQVAIKVLRPELAQSLGPARFLREIRIASRLIHPNILPVHDSGTADGLLFYVMPYVTGESLRDHLRRKGPLPLADGLRIAREVAEGLAYAHAQHVVHRDIKPANILLADTHAVIADFGLARAVEAAAEDELTSTGLALGTPPYMSPEQTFGSDQVDGRSDVYGLGCVLYEMLAGEPPFTGPSAQVIAAKHRQLPPPPIRHVRPHVPASVAAAIERALEKVPADRFQSAEEFARALADAHTAAPRMRRRSLRWGALLLAGAAALGAIVVARETRGGVSAAPTSTTAPVSALDPTHIAVLYFDNEGGDSVVRSVANGLTEDLIDQLDQVEALSVISSNGVRPYRQSAVPPDSIARALGVGTLVSGTVSGSLDRLRVTVRLIEPNGRQVDSELLEASAGDMHALRGELTQQVAVFLRQRLGREIQLRELRSGGDARAWVQIWRAEDLRENARELYTAGDTAAAQRTFDGADSLLALAERLDPDWIQPLISRGWIVADRITLADARTDTAIARWAPHGLALAQRALAMQPGHPPALELRGSMRFLQWLYSGEANDAAAAAAERDLRAADVPENPSRARAQTKLSHLLWRRGSFAEANLTARRAYATDAFLTDAPAVLYRLYATSLMLRQWDEATDWCAQGYRRFPQQWQFTLCRLEMLTMPAGEPDPARAWLLLAEMKRATPPSEWSVLSPRWHAVIAGVLARADLRDSARQVLGAARRDAAGDPEMDIYEADVRVLLGEEERALELLERYAASAPAQKAFIQGWPNFDPLHRYRRFRALAPP
jgi:TolB-like protein/tRNA A-37 threonylcarbamoyl transferase component Bud32